MAQKADDTKTSPVTLTLYHVNLSKIVCHIYIYIYIYIGFTSNHRLMLQNCFVWYKYHTHQAILTTELLKLESWQLNTEI